MINIALIDENMKVVNVIVCDDNHHLAFNEILINDNNPAYIGGDYYNGYFYPSSPGENYKRDGKGNWITDNIENTVNINKLIEEVWDPTKKEILSKIDKNFIYNDDSELNIISTRFDKDDILIETYQNIDIKDISNQNIKKIHDSNFYNNYVLVSKNKEDEITDFYFTCDANLNNIPDDIIQKYNINLDFKKYSFNLYFRFNTLGEFIGVYYAGDWDLLNFKYKNNDEFLNILKNYYKNKLFFSCIVKDFGNNAVYMFSYI